MKTLMVLLLGCLLVHPGAADTSPTTGTTQASEILRKARSVAGAASLGRVHSIAVKTESVGHTYEARILWPDRFQWVYENGKSTLDRRTVWVFARPMPGAAETLMEPAPELKGRLARRFVTTAAVFLLQVPEYEGLATREFRSAEGDGFKGNGLRITSADGINVSVYFDEERGVILGYGEDGFLQVGRNPATPARSITRIVDFMKVGGITFPRRLETAITPASGESTSSVTLVTEILINTLTEDDFRKVGR